MNIISTQAATAPIEREPVRSLHPIEPLIIAFLALLAHFVWREPWGDAWWSAAVAFTLLPRGEMWGRYGQWRWNRLILRWISATEVLFVVIAAFWLHQGGDSLWLTLAQTALALLSARVLAALADFVSTRVPIGERGAILMNWVCALLLLALLLPLLWTTDWHAVSQWRPDFSAIRSYRLDWGGAFSIFVMGLVTVLFIWPPVSLWNRALQPFDKRADVTTVHRAGAALVYIAACCAWWAFLTGAIHFICSQPNLWR